MKTSESINEIAKALAIFQSKVKQPEKDGSNPHFKSRYVTLDGTVKAIHDVAHEAGLSYTQMPVSTESGVGVVTVIFHNSGQYIEFDPFILPLEKKTAQGVGSATTYARRYSLSAAFGIVSDLDDDGNDASENEKTSNVNSSFKPISAKQVGMLKARALEFGSLRQKTDKEVLTALKVENVEKISSSQASELIKKLDGWIQKAKEDAVGA